MRAPKPSGRGTRAPSHSCDFGTAGRTRTGQNHHESTTRQSHCTWRFKSVPWDRRSFRRKRRSGRRSHHGMPRGDHVKVAGRGTRPACTLWLARETGFGSARGRIRLARTAHFGALPSTASASTTQAEIGCMVERIKPSNGKAQGSIGHRAGRNVSRAQRTSQWIKALRSSDPGLKSPQRASLAREAERTE